MASNPVTMVRKPALLYRLACFSRQPSLCFNTSARIPPNPLHKVSGFRSLFRSGSSANCGFKEMDHPKIRFGHLGSDSFRLFAVSNGGTGGGSGRYHGGSGGGNSADGDSDSGSGGGGSGKKWSFLSWYLSLLETYPVWTKAVTSALLTFIGDLICQLAIDQVPSLDWKRTSLFTLLGLVLVGPALHFWLYVMQVPFLHCLFYPFWSLTAVSGQSGGLWLIAGFMAYLFFKYLYLSKLVITPGASGAFLRLLLDQFLFAPIFIGVFLSTLVTLEGRPSQVMPKLEQEWFSAVVANWQLWIPFQFLNFRFVPQQFQVLAANFIALTTSVHFY